MTTGDIVTEILRRECWPLVSDDPLDKGGLSKGGITRQTLAEYRGRPVTRDEVRQLTEVDARALYLERYIERPGFGMLLRRSAPNTWAEHIVNLLVDYGVHSGPINASKALQRALGLPADGVIGDQTTEAFLVAKHELIYRLIFGDRLRHVTNVVVSNGSQLKFLRGWISRICEFIP
jgi:lysozyme family protein